MIAKWWANSVKKEIPILLIWLTRELGASVTRNWLNWPIRTRCIDCRPDIWWKDKIWSFGLRFWMKKMKTRSRLWTRSFLRPFLNAKMWKRWSALSRLSFRLSRARTLSTFWKELCSIIQSSEATKSFRICWSLPALRTSLRKWWIISRDSTIMMARKSQK